MKRISQSLLIMAFVLPLAALATEPPASKPAAPTKVASAGKDARALDRLQLDPTAITGNRELPKVMSIVPWKAAEPPGGPDRPMGSLIDEVLAPVDRDEFQREITYFRDLTSQSPAIPTTPTSPSPGATKP
jgi:hypothetical protein